MATTLIKYSPKVQDSQTPFKFSPPLLSPSCTTSNLNAKISSNVLTHDLYKMYSLLCEGALSIWLDAGCSPLPSPSISASNPCAHNFLARIRELDKNELQITASNNNLMDDVLGTALQAYASQWLYHSTPATCALTKSLWTRSRDKVHAAMALPSYRTFFALMLFGWTPIPQDCEESNHLEPHVSMDAAFKQFYHLRPDVSTQDPQDPKVNTVYWFGIVFDTAFSVVARRPVTVKTINSSDTWDVVEARDQSYRGLLDAMPITNELVVQVCRAGSACKIHAWRLVNRVQTAVFFKRKDPIKLQKLIQDAEEKIQSFAEIYGGFLSQCQANFEHLSPYAQMSWAYLHAHYHAGNLFFAEVLDKISQGGHNHGMDVEAKWRMSSLATADVARIVVKTPLASQFMKQTSLPSTSNIFHLDPYPQFVVEPMRLAGHALTDLRAQGLLDSQQALDAASDCLAALKSMSHTLAARRAYEDLSACVNIASSTPAPLRTVATTDITPTANLDVTDIPLNAKDVDAFIGCSDFAGVSPVPMTSLGMTPDSSSLFVSASISPNDEFIHVSPVSEHDEHTTAAAAALFDAEQEFSYSSSSMSPPDEPQRPLVRGQSQSHLQSQSVQSGLFDDSTSDFIDYTRSQYTYDLGTVPVKLTESI